MTTAPAPFKTNKLAEQPKQGAPTLGSGVTFAALTRGIAG